MILFLLSIQLVVGLIVCGLGVLVSAEEKKESTTAPEANETESETGETAAETENNGAIEKRGIGHGYGLGYGHGKQRAK